MDFVPIVLDDRNIKGLGLEQWIHKYATISYGTNEQQFIIGMVVILKFAVSNMKVWGRMNK